MQPERVERVVQDRARCLGAEAATEQIGVEDADGIPRPEVVTIDRVQARRTDEASVVFDRPVGLGVTTDFALVPLLRVLGRHVAVGLEVAAEAPVHLDPPTERLTLPRVGWPQRPEEHPLASELRGHLNDPSSWSRFMRD